MVFIHSLNNYTGSPNILSVIIKGFVARGYDVELITSRSEGFLSNIEGVKYHYTCYRWTNSAIVTLFWLFFSQVELFFKVLFSLKQHKLYYINSIVPFGAAFACWLTRKNYVCHVHENMQQQKPIYIIFRWVYRLCNRKSIFVSTYLKGTALNCRDGVVVYNSLSPDFQIKANEFRLESTSPKKKTILMVASLRKFKGVYEFVELAKRMPQYPFELVVSATKEEVDRFITEIGRVRNLTVYPSQNNLHPFYQQAKLLLQLSHPEAWVETFGLTILEALVYGVPAIVPNVGGPTELVEDRKNGYWVNPHNLPDIHSKIEQLMQDEKNYRIFSGNALEKSKRFSEEVMVNEIENYLIE